MSSGVSMLASVILTTALLLIPSMPLGAEQRKQMKMNRYDASGMLVPASVQAQATAAGERILLGGSAGPIPLMWALATAYEGKHPRETVDLLPKSIGADGGIKATAERRIDLGVIARRPEPDEEDYHLTVKLLAKVPVALVVPKDVPVTSLTETQILGIYSGKIANWREVGGHDARIWILTRNEADSNKKALRRGLPGFRELQETKDAIMLYEDQGMMNGLLRRPNTIGLLDIIRVRQSNGALKALAIDGVVPTAKNVRSGRYPLYNEFVVVTKGPPRGLVKRFLEFILSDEGARILTAFGMAPIR